MLIAAVLFIGATTKDIIDVDVDIAAEDVIDVNTEAETKVTAAETADSELSLIPTEERIPDSEEHVIAAEDIVPPVAPAAENQPIEKEYVFITVIQPAEEIPALPPAASANDFSPFQAPLISNLEQGKWYVQIGAYSRPETVEDEISRLGPSYPVAIQNIGTETDPLFRVLLGPLNQGESGAMLQRFKSIGYTDAFVRRN